MKKPKLVFKINRNNTAKLYVNGKWQKHVSYVQIEARPFSHEINIEQIKHDRNGHPVIENNDAVRVKKKFRFGKVE